MILDYLLLFSNEQAITADAVSTVLDFKAAGDAVGQELTIEARVTTAFAAGEDDTLQITLQTSDDNFVADTRDVVLSPVKSIEAIAAGTTLFKIRVPQGLGRYARLKYDVTIAAESEITSGKITAFLSKEL